MALNLTILGSGVYTSAGDSGGCGSIFHTFDTDSDALIIYFKLLGSDYDASGVDLMLLALILAIMAVDFTGFA